MCIHPFKIFYLEVYNFLGELDKTIPNKKFVSVVLNSVLTNFQILRPL